MLTKAAPTVHLQTSLRLDPWVSTYVPVISIKITGLFPVDPVCIKKYRHLANENITKIINLSVRETYHLRPQEPGDQRLLRR